MAALAAPGVHWTEVLAAAPVVGVLGVLIFEPALRRGGPPTRGGGQAVRVRMLVWYPVVLVAGAAIWWATGLGFVAVLVMLLAFLAVLAI